MRLRRWWCFPFPLPRSTVYSNRNQMHVPVVQLSVDQLLKRLLLKLQEVVLALRYHMIVNQVMVLVLLLLLTLARSARTGSVMYGTEENLMKTAQRFVQGKILPRHVHLVRIIMRMDQNGPARGKI